MNSRLESALRRERLIKSFSVIAVLLVAGTILFAVDNLLMSFVLAFVANYLLSPLVDVLERKGFSRESSIFLPFLAMAAVVGFSVYLVLPLVVDQLSLLGARLPQYQADSMNLLQGAERKFRNFFRLYDFDFSDTITVWITSEAQRLSRSVPSLFTGSLTVAIFAPFFAYFMLRDGRRVSRAVLSMVPNDLFELALTLQYKLNEQMGGFIRARFLEAAIVGFVVWIGLQVAGFPYAALLGAFAGVTNLIPYLGPLIGAVPAILIALISEEAMITSTMSINLIIVTSIYFLAQLIDMVFIIPFVVARIVNLHPVTVVIVIIVGSQIMGILGMMISIPVASAIKLIFQTFYRHLTEMRS
ncbi:MAG TPA: AI-2E family transporter [Bdellovibrionales bacterium]|nr:AI-2E family transporter [Bdellovibrionales bacterium]